MNLSLDYSNMVGTPCTGIRIDKKDILRLTPYVAEIINKLNNKEGDIKDQNIPMVGWQDLPETLTEKELEEINSKIAYIKNSCEIVFIIGIGGSYLGPKAVLEAIHGKNYNLFLKPKIFFIGCDTDPEYLEQCLGFAENKSLGAIVISKSGTTTEPALAFRILRNLIEKKNGYNAKKFIISITDKENGALRKLTQENEYESFTIPDDIGGRFSVLTPVGLVPMALAGIDLKSYVEGAREIKKLCDSNEIMKNPAALFAILRYLAMEKGAKAEYLVTNSVFFESNLDWATQLEPESEGHFNHGIHVIPGLFPRDLHSIGQIIQEGPRDIIEIAYKINKARKNSEIPVFSNNFDELDYILENNLTLNDINQLVIEGPLRAHYKAGVPNMTINIPEISPFYLGQLHYFLEKATAISGYLLRHNPFVQPGVKFWKEQFFIIAGKKGFEEEHKKYLEEKSNKSTEFVV